MYQKDQPPGIIPLGCEKIFSNIARKKAEDSSYTATVEVQYLELYMEKVKDLLDTNTNPTQNEGPGLKIRGPKPDGSFHVPDAQRMSISNSAQIISVLEAGLSKRVIEKTAMNPTSSRSHSIFTIYLHQESTSLGSLTSMINLIDLAGSERQGKTGATGVVMQQGIKINQSLSTLAKVI
jgi:hypothetical protein